jgi:hypothetical protein
MIALPFVLWIGFWDLPNWLATGWWRQQVLRAAFVVLAVAVYPTLRVQAWSTMLTAPPSRFARVADQSSSIPDDDRIAFRRASMLRDELTGRQLWPSMRTFLEFANDIHDLVSRKTYIASIGTSILDCVSWPI